MDRQNEDDNLSSDSNNNSECESDHDSELNEEETDVEARNLLQLIESHAVEVGPDDVKSKRTLMWKDWEIENEKWLDQQHIPEDVRLDNLDEKLVESVDPSLDLVMPLLRYQKEWLAWGLKQEKSSSKGGILADEMGMGKTVQAIALVLSNRQLCPELDEPGASSSTSVKTEVGEPGASSSTSVKTTLVICPVIAVIQWVNEIERFTTKGSNKVLAYHGSNRQKTLPDFSGYDFVITTYSIVESEYRNFYMLPKETCQWCGKRFHVNKLHSHVQRCYDAGKTVKTTKQCKKKGKLEEVDKKKAASKKGLISLLHFVKWNRIILDEAHCIKDRRSNTALAVFALKSSYKWALTGTPFQNHVGELYSLVRFLQITPYSYYFCKDCDCKVLKYPKVSCPGCPHSSGRHFCWWTKYIANPIAHNDNGERSRAMILLKEKVMKCILLRRTKKGRASDLTLPPRIIILRRDRFDATEQSYYTSLKEKSREHFDRYVKEGTLMSNYGRIFNLVTRLRQAVDHPYLVVHSKSAVAKGGRGEFCGLCHDVAEDPVVTSCEHLFCKSCLIEFCAAFGQPACPSCSEQLTVDFSANKHIQEIQNPSSSLKGFKPSSILNRIPRENFQTSTKIEALNEEIRNMVERDGSAKAIVFSQFSSFLDLIRYSLQKSGVKCVQLDGSMSMAAKEAAITRFNNEGDCRIFLMSLKTGGVALNLTIASHVFLMDPWWNPAVEQQAQDRIYRIGQYKPIRVVRFIIENTIEEKILKMQEIRKLAFEGTVEGSSKALDMLNQDDLVDLFLHP